MDIDLTQILRSMTQRELERARASCQRHGDEELVMIIERSMADSRRCPEERPR
jgi:hypothetical protein